MSGIDGLILDDFELYKRPYRGAPGGGGGGTRECRVRIDVPTGHTGSKDGRGGHIEAGHARPGAEPSLVAIWPLGR